MIRTLSLLVLLLLSSFAYAQDAPKLPGELKGSKDATLADGHTISWHLEHIKSGDTMVASMSLGALRDIKDPPDSLVISIANLALAEEIPDPNADRNDPGEWLRNNGRSTCVSLLYHFGEQNSVLAKPLAELLKNPKPEFRRRALQLMADMGRYTAEYLPEVMKLLDGDDVEFRWSGLRAAIRMGAKWSDVHEYVLTALNDPDVDLQKRGLEAVEFFGANAAECVDRVLELFDHKRTSELAYYTLERLGPALKPAIPKLLEFLKDEKPGRSSRAAGLLQNFAVEIMADDANRDLLMSMLLETEDGSALAGNLMLLVAAAPSRLSAEQVEVLLPRLKAGIEAEHPSAGALMLVRDLGTKAESLVEPVWALFQKLNEMDRYKRDYARLSTVYQFAFFASASAGRNNEEIRKFLIDGILSANKSTYDMDSNLYLAHYTWACELAELDLTAEVLKRLVESEEEINLARAIALIKDEPVPAEVIPSILKLLTRAKGKPVAGTGELIRALGSATDNETVVALQMIYGFGSRTFHDDVVFALSSMEEHNPRAHEALVDMLKAQPWAVSTFLAIHARCKRSDDFEPLYAKIREYFDADPRTYDHPMETLIETCDEEILPILPLMLEKDSSLNAHYYLKSWVKLASKIGAKANQARDKAIENLKERFEKNEYDSAYGIDSHVRYLMLTGGIDDELMEQIKEKVKASSVLSDEMRLMYVGLGMDEKLLIDSSFGYDVKNMYWDADGTYVRGLVSHPKVLAPYLAILQRRCLWGATKASRDAAREAVQAILADR